MNITDSAEESGGSNEGLSGTVNIFNVEIGVQLIIWIAIGVFFCCCCCLFFCYLDRRKKQVMEKGKKSIEMRNS